MTAVNFANIYIYVPIYNILVGTISSRAVSQGQYDGYGNFGGYNRPDDDPKIWGAKIFPTTHPRDEIYFSESGQA